MELGYLAVKMALEWNSEKEVGEFVPAVDHSREFEHCGRYRSPIFAFPEVEAFKIIATLGGYCGF